MVRPKEKLPSEHIVLHDQRRAPRRTVDLRVTNGSRELETTLLISQALSPHSTLEELIVQTLDTALKAVNAEGGSILIADASSLNNLSIIAPSVRSQSLLDQRFRGIMELPVRCSNRPSMPSFWMPRKIPPCRRGLISPQGP